MAEASLRTCSTCGNKKPLDHFRRKGKTWKTCNSHAVARSLISEKKRKLEPTHDGASKTWQAKVPDNYAHGASTGVVVAHMGTWNESNDQGIVAPKPGSKSGSHADTPWSMGATGFIGALPTYSRTELKSAGASSHLVNLPVSRCPLCREFTSDDMDELCKHLENHATKLGQTDQCSWIESQLQIHSTGKEYGPTHTPKSDERPGLVLFEGYRMHAYSQYVDDIVVKASKPKAQDGCWSAAAGAKKHNDYSIKSLHSAPPYIKPGSTPIASPVDPVSPPLVDAIDLLFVAIAKHDDNWVRSLAPHCTGLDHQLRPIRDSSGLIGTLTTRALTYAAMKGSDTSVEILLQCATSISSYHVDDCCGTALWAAVLWSRYDTVRQLCQTPEAEMIPHELASDSVDKHRHSLPGLGHRARLDKRILDSSLALAVHQADSHMATILLGRGATPMASFLNRGANPNTSVFASFKGVAPMDIPALCYAAYTNDSEMIDTLLAYGADVHAQCELGTVLSFLAGHGNAIAMQAVLNRGINPNAFPDFCWPPLASAAKSGSIECSNLLLGAGAMVDLQGRAWLSSSNLVQEIAGPTPLMAAIRYGQIHIADLLIQCGADINAQGGVYGSALGEAAHRHGKRQEAVSERKKLMDFCLSAGANTQAKCINCNGPCERVATYLQIRASSTPDQAIITPESVDFKLANCFEQTSISVQDSPRNSALASFNTRPSKGSFR